MYHDTYQVSLEVCHDTYRIVDQERYTALEDNIQVSNVEQRAIFTFLVEWFFLVFFYSLSRIATHITYGFL